MKDESSDYEWSEISKEEDSRSDHGLTICRDAPVRICQSEEEHISVAMRLTTPSSATAEAGAARAWRVERRRRKHGP